VSASGLRPLLRPILVRGLLPVLLYLGLLHGLDRAGGATLMLGAVAGTPYGAILAMGLLLLLRLYIVLVLPSMAAAWLAGRLSGWWSDRRPPAPAGPVRDPGPSPAP
jgi:hypothetical protein